MTLARLPMTAARINAAYEDYTLLDAGCRTMDLKPLLKSCSKYFGTDIIPAEGVFSCNLEEELPFEDDSFDIVTALDVLEHLNNPHDALNEFFRVARKAVFVSLPNMYYITFRKNFLLGKGISGKYVFPKNPVLDRHRWLMSYKETIDFIQHNSQNFNVEHEVILPIRGRIKSIAAEPIEKFLADRWPNLFVYGSLFEIRVQPS